MTRKFRAGVLLAVLAAFLAGIVVSLGLLHFRPLSITCMIPQMRL